MNFRELAGTLLVSSSFLSFVPNATFAQSTDFVLHDGDRSRSMETVLRTSGNIPEMSRNMS